MSAIVSVSPTSEDGVMCVVRTSMGHRLSLRGSAGDGEPRHVDGDDVLMKNMTLRLNAWAHALLELRALGSHDKKERKALRRESNGHEGAVKHIADLIDRLSADKTPERYCSACFSLAQHSKVDVPRGLAAYLCDNCGAPTLTCVAPGCQYMANRGAASFGVPRFCAEHRHDIASFEQADQLIDSPEDFGRFLVYDEKNLAKRMKVVGGVVAGISVVAPAALMAAPAVGGALGVARGLSGAAASKWGLAMLGGGAKAAGGLGIVGGTAVVTATGAALGGALGASVISAYVSEDPSFSIDRFRDGSGTPVLIARGFLTQAAMDWRAAVDLVADRYPDSPIYIVRWGSKELAAVGRTMLAQFGMNRGAAGLAGVGASANAAAAAVMAPVGAGLFAVGLAKNPWHTAKVRADRTGAALASILARTRIDDVILVGHSLGARAVLTAAEALATDPKAPRVETVHLLGAAIGAGSDWRALSESIDGPVHNYCSENDAVLKYLYTVAQLGSKALGRHGFRSQYDNLIDHDVTAAVSGHSAYFDSVRLA